MKNYQFMQQAIRLAYDNVDQSGGKPFGAVIVRNGEIIATGVNEVLVTHDPSAHAEIQAIRQATTKLQTDNLSDCEIYASGEPCPMCLTAIYWAKIPTVYYAYPEADAAAIGMATRPVLEQLKLPHDEKSIKIKQMYNEDPSLNPFQKWLEKQM